MSYRRIAVCLEVTPNDTFAFALDCEAGHEVGPLSTRIIEGRLGDPHVAAADRPSFGPVRATAGVVPEDDESVVSHDPLARLGPLGDEVVRGSLLHHGGVPGIERGPLPLDDARLQSSLIPPSGLLGALAARLYRTDRPEPERWWGRGGSCRLGPRSGCGS